MPHEHDQPASDTPQPDRYCEQCGTLMRKLRDWCYQCINPHCRQSKYFVWPAQPAASEATGRERVAALVAEWREQADAADRRAARHPEGWGGEAANTLNCCADQLEAALKGA
jgi:hypothetical protein